MVSLSKNRLVYLGGSFFAFLLIFALWSYAGPTLIARDIDLGPLFDQPAPNLRFDPPEKTFYDDPELAYSLQKPVTNWDEKRRHWLNLHPSFLPGSHDRIVMVTGSQPEPCEFPAGDHYLLRLFKNKVDYCRIHGCEVFYNNVFLQPKMNSYWSKYGILKAAMLAHPDAEWMWWVDADAVITDMEFRHPLEKYRGYNLIVNGSREEMFVEKSWVGLNAGVFLIRNCQWSLDFMDTWADMGPMGKEYSKWGQIEKSIFTDKMFPNSDDQTSLIYLLYKNQDLLNDKVYLETDYIFNGYWVWMVPKFKHVAETYAEMEKKGKHLRRRHAEKVTGQYAAFRWPYLKDAGMVGNRSRPFITHFNGCQPCSGNHNPMYKGKDCWDGLVKALNLADNQVLRNYGFIRSDLLDSDTLMEVPFDYPAEGPFG